MTELHTVDRDEWRTVLETLELLCGEYYFANNSPEDKRWLEQGDKLRALLSAQDETELPDIETVGKATVVLTGVEELDPPDYEDEPERRWMCNSTNSEGPCECYVLAGKPEPGCKRFNGYIDVEQQAGEQIEPLSHYDTGPFTEPVTPAPEKAEADRNIATTIRTLTQERDKYRNEARRLARERDYAVEQRDELLRLVGELDKSADSIVIAGSEKTGVGRRELGRLIHYATEIGTQEVE